MVSAGVIDEHLLGNPVILPPQHIHVARQVPITALTQNPKTRQPVS